MVFVDLTRGNDVVTMKFEQTGSHQGKITLKDRLLDERLQYLVGVTELTLPLDQTNMLTNKAANYVLLTLRRRNVGALVTAGGDESSVHIVRPDLGNYTTLTIDPARVPYLNTSGSFMKHIINWFNILDQKYRTAPVGGGDAIDPNEHGQQTLAEQGVTAGNPFGQQLFNVYFDPSGILVINGSPRGWNNFYIELSPFGKELLGFEHSTICVTQTGPNVFSTDPSELVTAGNITDAIMDIPVLVKGKQSIFRSLEHRVSINVESSLPTEQQLLLTNGTEQIHTYLETFEFENTFQVQSIGLTHEIISPSFVGKHKFRGANEPCQNWTKLTEFFDLRTIHLTISVTRREWEEATGKWKYLTNKFPISDDSRWSCELKFVSTS